MKEHENYTLFLDEAAHESNRSELSLIARVVDLVKYITFF